MDTQSLTGQAPGRSTTATAPGTATRSRTWVRVLAVAAAGVVLDWGGNQLGWWWVTVLTGVAAALLLRGRALAVVTLAVPLLSWGGELVWRWTTTDTTRISRVTIGLAGVGDDAAWLGYVLTLAYAVLLCAAGVWVAAAARQLVRAARDGRRNPIEQKEAVTDA
ncbi:hypothetical protein [Amycolatopsis vancoresmycina]|uniref:Uncharacterized protein n=1 Tax=Amycolatopsis vancoresmycina DSM 44592 TaxID=1292037 RepID=R1I1Z8_9PSEU|nr:hypothetical protein [Amycolatopsis vancoresmycina]EOD69845.1 hypothetical protein H480_04122 [Amycolatopsis vancoresmycina DSM 44592]